MEVDVLDSNQLKIVDRLAANTLQVLLTDDRISGTLLSLNPLIGYDPYNRR